MDSEEEAERLAKKKLILTSHKQRVIWARLTTVKRILIQQGMTTHEEFEAMSAAMVRDIDQKVLAGVRKDLGLDAAEAEE